MVLTCSVLVKESELPAPPRRQTRVGFGVLRESLAMVIGGTAGDSVGSKRQWPVKARWRAAMTMRPWKDPGTGACVEVSRRV